VKKIVLFVMLSLSMLSLGPALLPIQAHAQEGYTLPAWLMAKIRAKCGPDTDGTEVDWPGSGHFTCPDGTDSGPVSNNQHSQLQTDDGMPLVRCARHVTGGWYACLSNQLAPSQRVFPKTVKGTEVVVYGRGFFNAIQPDRYPFSPWSP
jgi:hypothetical protein